MEKMRFYYCFVVCLPRTNRNLSSIKEKLETEISVSISSTIPGVCTFSYRLTSHDLRLTYILVSLVLVSHIKARTLYSVITKRLSTILCESPPYLINALKKPNLLLSYQANNIMLLFLQLILSFRTNVHLLYLCK